MDFDALLKEKYHIELNPQQREAVYTTEGPLLLLAVPGSGKTTVVTARCAYMTMCRGIPPESILTLTFNRSAQRDMESRFARVFGGDAPGGLRFSTIHSFCYSVLREYGAAVGRKMPRLVEEGKARLLRNLYAEQSGGDYLSDDRLEDLANRIGYVKNNMLTDEEIRKGKWDIPNFPAIFSAYEAYKSANGCMDYDDMLGKALAVFRVKPEILERFRGRYRYVNVDEAQDTSRLQHAIIRELAAPRNNLFMVGDEDQSVYMFRAASPKYLLEFQQIYPDARILLMERNYRSTHAIVSGALRLIGRNTLRHAKRMITGNEIGLPPEETALGDMGLLPRHIASRLKESGDTGSTAVLYRENNSAAALMDALDREGIPFYMREHRLYFADHWVVRDILAHISLACEPLDIAALKQIYYKLNAGVSRATFDCAAELLGRGAPSALDALIACPGLRDGAAQRLRRIQLDLAAIPGLAPEAAVHYVMDRLGYDQYLKKTAGEGYYLEGLLHIAESLRSIAAGAASHAGLIARVSGLQELADRAAEPAAGRAVTLSTVHSAKGLEFDRVILCDLVEGRFPTAAAISDLEAGRKELMEEERRLFYVAVTRARKRVELVTAGRVCGERVKPSRFIRELLPRIPMRRMAGRMDGAAPRPSAPDASAASSAGRSEPAIEAGTEVFHRTFGAGVVVARSAENGVVAVRFPKYGVKTLSAAFCERSGVMRRKGKGNEEG